jgi:hypothetical protein
MTPANMILPSLVTCISRRASAGVGQCNLPSLHSHFAELTSQLTCFN